MRTTVTLIDVFNDRYEPVGTEDKKTAHAKGLWHRTFSALAINPTTRRVILQKKAPGRYSFDRPDYADITFGGHYHAGETIPDGVREVHEELGLPVAYDELHPIGLRQTAVTLAPDYIEREFQHWHLLPLGLDLDAIPLADAEVSGLVDIGLDDALALADGDTDTIAARYATRTDTGLQYNEATLISTDLIPNYLKLDQLYLRLFVAARRFCTGERTHVFW
jgi:8-oxo-dGTP pyrophosphatase MutT (NUDIX family)